MELARYLRIGCTNVIDSCTTASFIRHGVSEVWRPGLAVECCCDNDCSISKKPYIQEQPWYRSSTSASEHFFGFVAESFTMSVPFASEVSGLYAGPINLERRVISMKITSVCNSASGTHYGRQWLYSMLGLTNYTGNASTASLCSRPKSCDHQNVQVRISDCPGESGLRTLYDFKVKSIEVLDDSVDRASDGETYLVVATARQDIAYSTDYGHPWRKFDWTANGIQARRWLTPAQKASACPDERVCRNDGCSGCDFCGFIKKDCQCYDCGAPPVVPCYSEPFVTSNLSYRLESRGGFGASLRIRIAPGNTDMRNVTIRLFHVPEKEPCDRITQLDTCDKACCRSIGDPVTDCDSWRCVTPCQTILVPSICKCTELAIDASAQTATIRNVECSCLRLRDYIDKVDSEFETVKTPCKHNRCEDATHLIWDPAGGPIEWPEITSGVAYVVVSADYYGTDEHAQVEFATIEKEYF